MADGGAYDTFISYTRSDSDAAAELNGWLAARGSGACERADG
jgi:hypothetical protein